LPTAGGTFSPRLNQLWASGSAVLLWRRSSNGKTLAAEDCDQWYAPALRNGGTHLRVDANTIADAANDILAESASYRTIERRRLLADAAADVHRHLLCPCCILEYWSELLHLLTDVQKSTPDSEERFLAALHQAHTANLTIDAW